MRTKGSRAKSKRLASAGSGLGVAKMELDISQQGVVGTALAQNKVSFGLLFVSSSGQSNKVRWFIGDVKHLPASTPITSFAELDVIWFRKASNMDGGFKGTLRDFLRRVEKKTVGQKSAMRKGKKS